MTTEDAIATYEREKAAYLARNAGAEFIRVLAPRVIVRETVRRQQRAATRKLQRVSRKAKRVISERRKDEMRLYHRNWYAKNRERRLEQAKEYGRKVKASTRDRCTGINTRTPYTAPNETA